jgi:hypothetical protein
MIFSFRTASLRSVSGAVFRPLPPLEIVFPPPHHHHHQGTQHFRRRRRRRARRRAAAAAAAAARSSISRRRRRPLRQQKRSATTRMLLVLLVLLLLPPRLCRGTSSPLPRRRYFPNSCDSGASAWRKVLFAREGAPLTSLLISPKKTPIGRPSPPSSRHGSPRFATMARSTSSSRPATDNATPPPSTRSKSTTNSQSVSDWKSVTGSQSLVDTTAHENDDGDDDEQHNNKDSSNDSNNSNNHKKNNIISLPAECPDEGCHLFPNIYTSSPGGTPPR